MVSPSLKPLVRAKASALALGMVVIIGEVFVS
jgi:hypothetical protein